MTKSVIKWNQFNSDSFLGKMTEAKKTPWLRLNTFVSRNTIFHWYMSYKTVYSLIKQNKTKKTFTCSSDFHSWGPCPVHSPDHSCQMSGTLPPFNPVPPSAVQRLCGAEWLGAPVSTTVAPFPAGCQKGPFRYDRFAGRGRVFGVPVSSHRRSHTYPIGFQCHGES